MNILYALILLYISYYTFSFANVVWKEGKKICEYMYINFRSTNYYYSNCIFLNEKFIKCNIKISNIKILLHEEW